MDSATFRVFRFDPTADREPRYSTYRVPVRKGTTLLEALLWVVDHVDGSLSFRCACREAICGACGMFVNGKYQLACKTQVHELGNSEIVVHPLPHFPVVKDLVVDMRAFWEKYGAIHPYLIAQGSGDREFEQSHTDRQALEEILNCIHCACCYSGCQTARANPDYPGPAALLKASRFAADTRDQGGAGRLKLVAGKDGVWLCQRSAECAETCPKEIKINRAIEILKEKATRSGLSG